jgi:uncharacterized oxidoreductase
VRISGRTVLITGGAGGIGRELARRFLRADGQVIVCGRSPERLAAAAAELPGLHTIVCDLTDLDSVDDMATEIEESYPGLDVLINNAAVTSLLDVRQPDVPQLVQEQVDTNIMGTVHATWRLLPLLERQPDACLAIVTSGIAYAPAPDVFGYSLTKAALNSLTRSLRHVLKDTSIRVVEIVPPAVDTDMISQLDCKKMSVAAVGDRVMRGLTHNRSAIRMGQTHLTHVVNRVWPAGAEMLIQRSFR